MKRQKKHTGTASIGLKPAMCECAFRMIRLARTGAMAPIKTMQFKKLCRSLSRSRKEAENMPACVAIACRSLFFVIFGNRRFNVYKQCAQQSCSQVWFKVNVHRFPECQRILDAELRALFRLKAIHAMGTLTSGAAVTTRPWR